jgi:hypothetical protein
MFMVLHKESAVRKNVYMDRIVDRCGVPVGVLVPTVGLGCGWFMQGSKKRWQKFQRLAGGEVMGQKLGWNREKGVIEKKAKGRKREETVSYLGHKTP